MSTGEWRNPLGYEERYTGVPPAPGGAVEKFAPLKPWPDPIDERLREIRERHAARIVPGAWINQCYADFIANSPADINFLLDQIDSLREARDRYRTALDYISFHRDHLDATHRRPLSGET